MHTFSCIMCILTVLFSTCKIQMRSLGSSLRFAPSSQIAEGEERFPDLDQLTETTHLIYTSRLEVLRSSISSCVNKEDGLFGG